MGCNIHRLKVRGAPAIGIAAAYTLYLEVKNSDAKDLRNFIMNFLR